MTEDLRLVIITIGGHMNLSDMLRTNGLSNHKIAIVSLTSEGHSNREISLKLGITERAVKYSLNQVYKKLNVKSRAQLIVKCLF